MKRHLFATAILLMLLPAAASAQWYLFPGKRQAGDSTAVAGKVLVPVDAENADASLSGGMQTDSVFRVTLILPFRSGATPSSNFLDFYCGVLMAADDLCSSDKQYEISVFDSTLGLPSSWEISDSDLIIGPVSCEDMQTIIPRARGKYIVSPLDPKVASLTSEFNVIQAPSGWEAQVDELVLWIGEDLRAGDTVVLLQSAEDAGGEMTERLARKLSEAGIKYEIGSDPAMKEGTTSATCRFILASDNDGFCSAAVRSIALMNLRGGSNILYGTSKLRSLPDLEVESIHAASARIAASYYADPYDSSVRLFNERYKTIFKGEPGQWVYQGYDLMNYFGGTLRYAGGDWPQKIASCPGKGLQADFRFGAAGKANSAVRRLKYNSDNTITVVQQMIWKE